MKNTISFLLAIGLFCSGLYAQPGSIRIHWKDTAAVHPELQAEFDNFILPSIREEIHLLDNFIAEKWERGFFEKRLATIKEPQAREKIRKGLVDMTKKVSEISHLCRKIPRHLDALEKNEERLPAMVEEGVFTSRSALLRYKKEEISPIEQSFRLDMKELNTNLRSLFSLIKAYLYDTRNLEEPILSVLLSDYITQLKKAERELAMVKSKLKEIERDLKALSEESGALRDSLRRLELEKQGQLEEKKAVERKLSEVNRQLDSMTNLLSLAKEEYEQEKESISLKLSLAKAYYEDSLFRIKSDHFIAENELKEVKYSLKRMLDSLDQVKQVLIAKESERRELEEEIQKLKDKYRQALNEGKNLKLALVLLTIFLFSNFFLAGGLKKKNVQLKQKKELLEFYLRELPHRVKNNLQDIIALLSMQADELNDPTAKRALKDAEHRIYAVNLLHRHLYKENQIHLTTVSLRDYIHDLTGYLSEICNGNAGEMEQLLYIQDVHVDIDKAAFIGLILSELISNSFEHALANTNKPKLLVRLSANEGWMNISVKDNGQGLPPQALSNDQQSFGLFLVRKLVQAEKGTVNFFNDDGACCEISLPVSAGIYVQALNKTL